jgi:transposase InsO family protein
VRGLPRRTAYYIARGRPAGRYRRASDGTVLQQIHAVTKSRATYGYRRVWAMVNRTFRTRYNRKRSRRLMQLHGLMLAPRVHRRHGRPHRGQIQQPASNQRWCSDVFLIPCWSGEVVSVAFAIDCHDREVPASVASPRPLTGADIRTLMDRTLWARFGDVTLTAPHTIQWLSDNGPQYTATASVLYAHELGLVPITTPAYSPQSNGLAEAFVKTFKRDYVDGAELRNAEAVLAQLGTWFEDYNTRAPHSALGMRSPAEFRALMAAAATPHWPQDARSAGGPLSGYPRKSGWRRAMRAANLSSPPEQNFGEHSNVQHEQPWPRYEGPPDGAHLLLAAWQRAGQLGGTIARDREQPQDIVERAHLLGGPVGPARRGGGSREPS